MGTGSFGGGSGDFASDTDWSGTDSVEERIQALRDLTDTINAAPNAATVGPTIYKALRKRGRAAVIRQNLTDGCTTAAFGALLRASRTVRNGGSFVGAFEAVGSPANVRRMSLGALADRLAGIGASRTTDENVRELCRAATRSALRQTVGNDGELFNETTIGNLGSDFDAKALDRFANRFLGTLIFEQVRHDLHALTNTGELTVAQISEQIAASWIDRFRDTVAKGKKQTDMNALLQSIAEDYTRYAGALDE